MVITYDNNIISLLPFARRDVAKDGLQATSHTSITITGYSLIPYKYIVYIPQN